MTRSSQPSASPGEDLRIAVGDRAMTGRALGAGRPIVLVHSLLADRTSFEPLAALLATAHRVTMLDLPGFGGSHAVSGGLEAVADCVAAAIGEIEREAGEKPVVLGNGYGGFVTLLAAIRHPKLARKLVLADCGAVFDEPGRQAFRNMSAAVRAKGLAAIADVAMRRLFAPGFQAAHPGLIEERKARFVAMEPETFHLACAALASLDLRAELAGVTVPVLVLVGEQDEATPPAMARELAAGLPHATLHILPACAHVPQLQSPEQFHQAMAAFID
jgi:3-oxoadipate enol-lactonase